MKNARASGAFVLISALISILTSTKEIVDQMGGSLICFVSFGCGASDLRKGLTAGRPGPQGPFCVAACSPAGRPVLLPRGALQRLRFMSNKTMFVREKYAVDCF
jgi:hypothetical protein